MAEYKGKYISQSDGTYKVELYEDDTLKHTLDADNVGMAKAMIIPWHAQKGYTDLSVKSDSFTPDMDNFDTLYVKT